MRVKIAYTVELEEVEPEVQEVLSKGLNNLEEALKLATKACMGLAKTDTSLKDVLEKLENARKEMFKADSALSDSYEILAGYSQVLEKAAEEENDEEI